ncbi:MAG: CAP domain-containing protein [Chloroflexota bacterium]|nr:CAP domain-containing protein [Chloroflexota bacterium]
MNRLSITISMMVALCLLMAGALLPAQAQAGGDTQVLALVNTARQNAGLHSLVMNATLVQAAQGHSNYMATTGVLSHTGSGGSSVGQRVTAAGYGWNAVGENILYRWDLNAQGAFDQWWNSTGHRNNMMSATYCDIGIASARHSDGRYFYTMVLARRSGVSLCPLTPTPTPSTATLNGTVAIQGRSAGMPAMSVSLTVQLYSGATLHSTHTPPTNTSGVFSLTGLPIGTYTVRIKHAQYLAVAQQVTLAGGTNTISFGTLRAGDVNNDNQVTMLDFSAMAASFNIGSGQQSYDARADFNGDGGISLVDFSLLSANFNQTGA